MIHKLTVYKANGKVEVKKQSEPFTLKELQAIVGGNIELVPQEFYLNEEWFKRDHSEAHLQISKDGVSDDFAVWCNEDGKGLELSPNAKLKPTSYDQIVGDVVVQESVK